MSLISTDVPTLKINGNDLQNLIKFIYKHEQLLKEFGAIKIQPSIDCQLAFKKRPNKIISGPIAEQIVKINEDESIYFVQKIDYTNQTTQKKLLVKDESSFWSSLPCCSKQQRLVNISLSPNKSFFCQKIPRMYFGIHSLPNQSLLRLGGSQLTRQFVPCMKRAHGSGAIFPLTSAPQRLFSIDYHHEGGAHYWYIIPTRERDALRKVIGHKNFSVCLEHGKLFVHPSILDKNNIRYHRIIQRPNEFVVLSAGTLAQSFTVDASWSESITFALPSWIEEGHASVAVSPCECNISNIYSLNTINITLFTRNLIQKYIRSHLNNGTHDKSMSLEDKNNIDTVTVPISNSIDDNSLNVNIVSWTNAKPIIPISRLVSTCYDPTTPATTTSLSCSFTGKDKNTRDENNVDMEYELLEEGTFEDGTDRSISLTTPIYSVSTEYTLELNLQSQPDQTTQFTNIYENAGNNYNLDSDFFIFDELMNLDIPNDPICLSTQTQTDKHVEILENTSERQSNNPSTFTLDTHTTTINERNDHKKKTTNHHNALFVSRLRNDVEISDIRRHFTGSTKVKIKRHRTMPHFKYAVICHRTSEEAEYNLQRPVNWYLLGSECRVEYAYDHLTPSNNCKSFDKKKVVVSRIPENVSENELHRLFANCHILRYWPAYTVRLAATTTHTKHNSKMLLGYAFIGFNDERQAASVVDQAEKYKINGQQLSVSFYSNRN